MKNEIDQRTMRPVACGTFAEPLRTGVYDAASLGENRAGGGVHDGGDGERFCADADRVVGRILRRPPPAGSGPEATPPIIEDAGRAGRAGRAEGAKRECGGRSGHSRRGAAARYNSPHEEIRSALTPIAQTTCTVALYTGCTTNIKPIEPIQSRGDVGAG